MIKYLQAKRAKKGFTTIELIVVIAIIAVLIAVIAPGLSTERSLKTASNTYARNFYSAVQYCFTKYMKFESYLSMDLKNEAAENKVIDYYDKLNGNYPTHKVTFIEMYVQNGKKVYIHVNTSLEDLLKDARTAPTESDSAATAFEKTLLTDLNNLVGDDKNGYYFAAVYFEDAENLSSAENVTATVRVLYTHYSQTDLPMPTGSWESYVNENLQFMEDQRLSTGVVCGTCTSLKDTRGSGEHYIGVEGTYFMDGKKDSADY